MTLEYELNLYGLRGRYALIDNWKIGIWDTNDRQEPFPREHIREVKYCHGGVNYCNGEQSLSNRRGEPWFRNYAAGQDQINTKEKEKLYAPAPKGLQKEL